MKIQPAFEIRFRVSLALKPNKKVMNEIHFGLIEPFGAWNLALAPSVQPTAVLGNGSCPT